MFNLIQTSQFEPEKIKRYFDKNCELFGDSIHSVGWYNVHTQETRFKILAGIAPLSYHSVLDIGCGLGDLSAFFQKYGIKAIYKGIDLSEKMVSIAKKKYAGFVFEIKDFLNADFKDVSDYILCSGALNYRVQNQDLYLKTSVKKMFSLCKKGVAFNVLSSLTPQDQKEEQAFYYYKPDQVLATCLSISQTAILRHDYLPNDFTIYLYKSVFIS